MKNLIIALLLTSCATAQQDKLQTELSNHITKCICLMNEGQEIRSHEIAWHDRDKLMEQMNSCKCTVEFKMNEVEDPLQYVKPNTLFYRPIKLYPWDEKTLGGTNPYANIKKVD